jgi:hypothetical protein
MSPASRRSGSPSTVASSRTSSRRGRACDLRAWLRDGRLAALRHGERHERCGGDRCRRRGAARPDAAEPGRPVARQPAGWVRAAGRRAGDCRRCGDIPARRVGGRGSRGAADDARLRHLAGAALACDTHARRAERLDAPAAVVDQRRRGRRVGGAGVQGRPQPPRAARRACGASSGERARVRCPDCPDGHRRRPQIAASGSGDAARSVGTRVRARAGHAARPGCDRPTSFPASDTDPAILSVQAGSLVHDHGLQIQAVSRLDILLYSASGRYLGVMARLRDLLPGSYSFGITGRGPTSARSRGLVRAAGRRLADAAARRETEPGAGLVQSGVD